MNEAGRHRRAAQMTAQMISRYADLVEQNIIDGRIALRALVDVMGDSPATSATVALDSLTASLMEAGHAVRIARVAATETIMYSDLL